jgi:hypothetical protein
MRTSIQSPELAQGAKGWFDINKYHNEKISQCYATYSEISYLFNVKCTDARRILLTISEEPEEGAIKLKYARGSSEYEGGRFRWFPYQDSPIYDKNLYMSGVTFTPYFRELVLKFLKKRYIPVGTIIYLKVDIKLRNISWNF